MRMSRRSGAAGAERSSFTDWARGVYGRLPKKPKVVLEPAKIDIRNISTNTLNLKVKLVANETVEGKKGAEKKKKRKGKIIVY